MSLPTQVHDFLALYCVHAIYWRSGFGWHLGHEDGASFQPWLLSHGFLINIAYIHSLIAQSVDPEEEGTAYCPKGE
jgi:hypothetical protein